MREGASEVRSFLFASVVALGKEGRARHEGRGVLEWTAWAFADGGVWYRCWLLGVRMWMRSQRYEGTRGVLWGGDGGGRAGSAVGEGTSRRRIESPGSGWSTLLHCVNIHDECYGTSIRPWRSFPTTGARIFFCLISCRASVVSVHHLLSIRSFSIFRFFICTSPDPNEEPKSRVLNFASSSTPSLPPLRLHH